MPEGGNKRNSVPFFIMNTYYRHKAAFSIIFKTTFHFFVFVYNKNDVRITFKPQEEKGHEKKPPEGGHFR
jgi:hypothetical protein